MEALFFADQHAAERQAAITATGAIVRENTGYSLILDVSVAQLRAVLRVPGVCAVESYAPADVDNSRAGVITQANAVRSFRNVTFLTNLDGTGETVGIVDTGLDTGAQATLHPDLFGRVSFIANLNGANPAADGQPNPAGPAGCCDPARNPCCWKCGWQRRVVGRPCARGCA